PLDLLRRHGDPNGVVALTGALVGRGIGGDARHDALDLAGRDHAADSVNRQLKHGSVLRGTNVDALELVFGGDLALDDLADLAVHFAQFLGNLAGEVLVYLQDLQGGFRNLAFGLRRRRDQLTAFAIEPRRLALEGGEPG